MSAAKLPDALLEFFKATEREVHELYRPEWLLSNLDDRVWYVRGSAEIRQVSGEIKGAVVLRWDKTLWNGFLIDPLFTKVLYQAKLITILAFDGVHQKLGNTLKTISAFHAFIFRVIEYLDYKYGGSFHSDGFKVLTCEDVAEMLELSVESGVSGTGFWIERLNVKVVERVGENTNHKIMVSFLESLGAYDQYGKISIIQIGRLINVEPRRLSRSSSFLTYLKKFEKGPAPGKSKEISQKTVVQLANWFVTFTQVLILSPIETSMDLEGEYVLMDLVKQFRNPGIGRTKSMPRNVARTLIRECCLWIQSFSYVQTYVSEVIEIAIKLSNENRNVTVYESLVDAESECLVPSALRKIAHFFQEDEFVMGRVDKHFLAPPFTIKLMRFHTAVCFVLVALLSCSRRKEVLEVGSADLIEKSGLKYLNVSLRKTGMDSSRFKFAKPVPALVFTVLKSLDDLKADWLKLLPCTDSLLGARSFFKISYKGIFPLAANDVYLPLKMLSAYSNIVDSSGKPWVVLPHQLRRYFALTFFHDSGAENSLPALTWFMGHENIEGTWRYIKESLTGKEISASEAAMATSAICSGDESEGAARLRTVIYEYFGCSNISLMDEDEVQDYLELLSEKGVFSATPIEIGLGNKKRVSIMISIMEQ